MPLFKLSKKSTLYFSAFACVIAACGMSGCETTSFDKMRLGHNHNSLPEQYEPEVVENTDDTADSEFSFPYDEQGSSSK